jgi:DNA-binding NtrC family response regulator
MKKKDGGSAMKKVLMIVEDFDSIRNLVGRYFQVDGYEVISAGNMHEAMMIGQHEEPNVVIVDFDMSNDPYVTVTMLHNILPESKVIVMDGRKRQCDAEEVTKAGATLVMERQFNPSSLEQIVHGQFAAVQA